MENNHRFRSPTARHAQRSFRHDPVPVVRPVQAQSTTLSIQSDPMPVHKELHLKLNFRFIKWLRNHTIRPLKRGAYYVVKTYLNGSKRRRAAMLTVVGIVLLTTVFPAFEGLIQNKTYALSPGENAVLLKTSKSMASLLKLDAKTGAYMFNQDYKPASAATDIKGGGAFIKAEISQDASKGIKVTDPMNNVDFTIRPLFDLGTGKQDQNRVVYPAFNGGGHLVYTAGGIGIKQEVTLDHYIGDDLKYAYELDLGDSYAAKIEQNGAVGIYGSSLPLASATAGSDKDKALLKKAQQKAVKDKLLFVLPAPTIKESGSRAAVSKAHYELKDNKLNVLVDNLKNASYPLSIDPTVTAASGYGGNGLFSFDSNIETNVYVDPSNGYFQRSSLTGGNLLTWASASSSVAVPHFLGAAVVYAGTLYVIGGTSSTTTTNISNGANSHLIEQSKINSNGTLAGFTDGNYSGLPSGGLSRFQVLTYNGYIYLIDGINGFTSTAAGGTVSNNVYYTRVTSESYGAFTNGAQLKNWSTTTNKPSTAVFNYGATVYNGYIYLAGGLNSSNTAQSSVLYSAILPSGDLGAFTSTTAMSSGRFGMDMQAYNGHLYILGGNTNTIASPTLTATTLYASIASNGSVADSAWKSGSTLVSSDGASTQAMENFGSQFAMIYNGYMYVTGGCTSASASDSCTAIASYTQLAQLNADGSLGTFFPNDFQQGGTATLTRAGTPTLGYNGAMYSVGGCSVMLSTAVSCSTTNLTSSYATVNAVIGDISNNRNPTVLPAALMGHSTIVLNGYLYLIGGCNTVTGSPYDCVAQRSANYITYYSKLNADGSIGSWNNNTNSTNATSLHFDGQVTPVFGSADCAAGGADQCGLFGAAVAAYNGYIYVVGGNDGTNNATNGYSNGVYYMKPDPSTGATTTWTKSGNTISRAVSELGAIATNGSLYIFGGCYATTGIGCSSYSNQVQRSVLNASTGAPGAFTATSGAGSQLQLPTDGRSAFGVAYYGGYIYLAGGIDASNNQLATVVRATINSSGDIVAITGQSAWTATSASMTAPRRRTVAAVVNGYMYVVGGHDASANGGSGATYGDVQIGKLDLSTSANGNIIGQPATPTQFTQSATSTLTPRWNPAIAFGNGFMYVTGGCTVGPPPTGCTTISTTNESFVVYNANNLGVNSWNSQANTYVSASPTAAANRLGAGSVAYNGYLYVAGGCTTYTMSTNTCSAASTDVDYAPINADGTLGAWTSSTALANLYAFNQLVAVNGTLYLLTGENSTGTAKSVVRYSVIGASGAPGAWTDTTFSLPITLTKAAVVTYANRIYVAGGYDNTTAANQNKVYYTPALPTGGDITSAWTQTTSSFSTARRELSLVTAGAFLYVIGGYDGTNYYSDVQVATPNTSTGNITSWTTVGEIPYKQAGMSAVGANGYIYLFGGRNGNTASSCTDDVTFGAVNGNGTVADWQQPANTLTGARFGTALAYSNGYFFVSGGHDCTNIASTNVIMQSGQLSEAIHATYTRYVDFGADATLRQLYVLGTNAQISGTDIDRWKIIVKTSTSINNSWGQKYTQILTGLGTGPTYGSPITFQALNGAGVDQGASRYWDITFDIDQTQSFNFPDTTQPQITKYDFYFSPGPSKRLRNGKTFVNDQQTTLDAHP